MQITLEQADRIRKAFGPCSSVYECMDLEDIVREAEGYATVKAFVRRLLKGEELFLEQRGNQWSGENEEEFRAAVAEDKAFVKSMRVRVLNLQL